MVKVHDKRAKAKKVLGVAKGKRACFGRCLGRSENQVDEVDELRFQFTRFFS